MRILAWRNLVHDKVRLSVTVTCSVPLRGTTLLLRAGIDDWGGVSPVTPDHVNPERPWPQIDELAAGSAAGGLHAARAADDLPGVRPRRRAVARPAAGARTWRRWPTRTAWPSRTRCRWAGPGRSPTRRRPGGRTDLHATIDTDGPHRRPARRLRLRLRRLGRGRRRTRMAAGASRRRPTAACAARTPTCRRRCGWPRDDPAALLEPRHEDGGAGAVRRRRRGAGRAGRIADDLRRDAVGDDVTYVVNRNINFSNVCYVGCRFCAFAQRERDADAYRLSVEQVADRAEEAWRAGATEVCMQGGIDPKLPVTAYADLVRAIKAAGAGHARARVLARWRSSPPRPRRACPSATG